MIMLHKQTPKIAKHNTTFHATIRVTSLRIAINEIVKRLTSTRLVRRKQLITATSSKNLASMREKEKEWQSRDLYNLTIALVISKLCYLYLFHTPQITITTIAPTI